MASSTLIAASLDPSVEAAIVTAAVTVALAAVGGIVALMTRKRLRQRDLYSCAYKAAMSWKEMLYRVRRRPEGAKSDEALIDRFHSLQEELDYYQGWIGSESPWMGRSYCRLVNAVKKETGEPIVSAWAEPERRPPANATFDDDTHPNCKKASDRFLFDVRCHLSIFPPMRLVVVWRNRKWLGGTV